MSAAFRLGLDTYSYHFAAPVWPPVPPSPMTLTNYLERAAELAIDGVALADWAHLKGVDPDGLCQQAEGLGLYLEIGTGGTDAAHLRDAMELARGWGSKVVRTFLSIGRTWRNSQDYGSMADEAVEALRRIVPTCEATGVALAIENHQDLTAAELAGLLDRVDHPMIGVCWDSGNSLGVLEHPLDGLRLLAGRTLTVHLKSYALAVPPDRPGYVLVGVPAAMNGQMLSETLRTLAAESPAEVLHLNIESAVEVIPVTPRRPGWRDEYTGRAEEILARCGATPWEHLADWIPSPDSPLQELLSTEDRLVRRSAAEARELLRTVRRDLGRSDCTDN